MYGWRARVGLIAPSRGDVMMHEFNMVAPDGVMVTPYILNLKELSAEELLTTNQRYAEAVKALDRERVDVIYVGGTPPQIVNGLEAYGELATHLRSLTDIPLITCMEGEVAALKGNGVTRAAVLTPHEDELNVRFRALLEGESIKVVALRGMGLRPAYEISFITDYEVHRHLLELGQETSTESDGIYMTCGRWPSLNRLWEVEEVMGRPVMSSSQTWIWSTLGRLGIRPRPGRWGSLFDVDASILEDVASRYMSPTAR